MLGKEKPSAVGWCWIDATVYFERGYFMLAATSPPREHNEEAPRKADDEVRKYVLNV